MSYNNADMEEIKKDIDDMINTQCTHCTHGTHSIISSDVFSAIRNLKHDKKDGDSEIVSDCIIKSWWVFESSYCNLIHNYAETWFVHIWQF